MRNLKFWVISFFVITFQSCFKDDGDPLPTSGENSFNARLNGEQFTAEDVWKWPRTYYGINASVHDNNWLLRFSNSSSLIIFISLHKVEEVGYYEVGIDENFFFDHESNISSVLIRTGNVEVKYHTNFPELNEKIEITKIEGDSIIIGEFEKITLSDPDNPNKKVILTNGKFNINRTTLNQIDL